MLKLELENGKDWIDILQAIRDIVEEAVFIAKPDGLYLKAMDSARVSMVEMYLPAIFFSDYSIEGEEVKLAISIIDMVKSLKGIKKGYRLTISTTEENTLRLLFSGKGSFIFEFPMLDISYEAIPELKLKFDAKIKIETRVLGDAIEKIEKFCDYAVFKVSEEKLSIYGKSEKGKAATEFSKDDLISLEVQNECISAYSTEYLLNILGKDELSEVTILELGNKIPLKATYQLINEGELSYYLAPRTEIE